METIKINGNKPFVVSYEPNDTSKETILRGFKRLPGALRFLEKVRGNGFINTHILKRRKSGYILRPEF